MAKLYFYYSSMNAGKSTALLQSSYNYQERGMRTLVLTPELDAIALVPICPHTLSNRPIVIGADSMIEISACGHTNPEDVRITCDGAISLTITDGDTLRVSRHPTRIRLLHPAGYDHFDVLRAKLGWGESPKH